MIKAIVFDCFGVLITDGLELLVQQLEQTQPDARKQVFDIIRQVNMGMLNPAESHRMLAEYLQVSDTEWRQKVSAGEVKNLELITWIKELRRHYKTALLSNTGKGSLARRFELAELDELFDEIVASADVGMVKPDPDIYKLTADRLQVLPEECVYFDDRPHQVEGASAIGMHAFLFTNVGQARRDLQTTLADTKR